MAIKFLNSLNADSGVLYVDANSNRVGIGTTSPAVGLDVRPLARFWHGSTSHFTQFSNGNEINTFNSSGGSTVMYLQYRSGSLNVGAGTLIVQSGNGNVGIGTTSPAAKLEVVASTSGSIKFTQGANAYQQQIETTGHTIFQRPDNHIFQVKRGTTTDMYIQSNGNVGIGTTNPLERLHINGAIKLDQSANVVGNGIAHHTNGYLYVTGGTAGAAIGNDSYSSAVYALDNGSLELYAGSSNRLHITSGGNVGIGLTNPSQKLHVDGNIKANGSVSVTNIVTNRIVKFNGSVLDDSLLYDNGTSIGLGTTSPNPWAQLETSGTVAVGGILYVKSSQKIQGLTGFPGSAGNLSINPDGGNVGIGTTSPSYKLDVNGEGRITGMTFTASGATRAISTHSSAGQLQLNGGTSATTGAYINIAGDSYSTGDYVEIIAGRTYFTGNVGIGTSSPEQKLHLSGNFLLQNNKEIRFKDTGGTQRTITRVNSSNELEIGWSGSGPVKFMGGGSYTERMRIHTDGNVGIGKTNPVRTLDINGSFLARTASTNLEYNNGVIYHGGSYYQFSSGSNYLLYGRSGMGLVFGSNDSEAARFDLSGNLGIGTTSPTAALHVQKAINGGFAGTIYNTQATGGFGLSVRGGNSSAEDALRVQNVGGTYLLNVKGNGNVGIGTTSPQTNLDVFSGTGGTLRLGTSDTVVLGGDTIGRIEFFSSDATNTNSGLGAFIDLVADGSQDHFNPNGDLRFGTSYASASAATTRMTIKGNGNVGIGTTSPSEKLEVLGDIRFGGSTNGDWAVLEYGTKSIQFTQSNAGSGGHEMKFRTPGWSTDAFIYTNGSTERFRITGTGNVGIGTTSPSAKLHVDGDVRITGAYYDSNNSAGTSGQVLSSTATGTDWVSLSEIQGVDGSGTTNYIAKWSDTDTIANSVIYDNGTDVGIGTTSPNVELAVYQTSTPRLHLQNSTSGTAYNKGFQLALSDNDGYLWNWQNGSTIFGTNNTERMRITSAGNVGIGTTSPNGKLHVYGGRLVLDNIATAQTAIQFNSAGSEKIVMYRPTSTEDFRIYTPAAGDAFTLLQSGNVGIGTTSPQQKLDVNGNIGLSGNGTGNRWILLNETNTYAGTLRIQAGGGSAGYGGAINMYGHSHATNPGDVAVGISNGSGGSFRVNSTGIDTGTDLFIVKSSGNVGIGTTSPSYKLDVQGNAGLATINTNGAIQAGGQFISGAGEFVSSSSGTDVNFRAGSTHLMVLKTSGNVGIGTTSPSEKLEVDGNVKANSFIGGNEAGIYTFNDTVNASASEDIFSISNQHGAQAFRVTFVCSTSSYSVAKTFEVVHSHGIDPVFFKVVDTGAFGGHDFDVSFATEAGGGAANNNKIICTITNNSTTVNADIATTVFLGGSPTTITVTAL